MTTHPVLRSFGRALAGLGALVASALLASPASALAAREVPITVEVGDHRERHHGFFDSDGEATDRSELDVERALRGRPWLEVVARDGEVAIEVTRRYVTESSRTKPKDGKLSVTWRYVVRAAIRSRDERDALEVSTTSSETLREDEANRSRRENYRDGSTFERLARELAERANGWILTRLDALRPDRPDAGFRHEVKHKLLLMNDGLEVTEVLPGSPAERAGVRVGDRVRAIDRETGTSEMDLRARTWWIEPPGTRVRLELERDKQRRQLECEVQPRRQWAGSALEHAEPERARADEPEGREREDSPALRVHPGMRPAEVARLLGKPLRAVAFESRTVWTYDGFRVVFVDGMVSDVE